MQIGAARVSVDSPEPGHVPQVVDVEAREIGGVVVRAEIAQAGAAGEVEGGAGPLAQLRRGAAEGIGAGADGDAEAVFDGAAAAVELGDSLRQGDAGKVEVLDTVRADLDAGGGGFAQGGPVEKWAARMGGGAVDEERGGELPLREKWDGVVEKVAVAVVEGEG